MKSALGIIAVVMGLIGYVPYFRTIFSGKTKPHAFTWLVWSVLTGIAFAAQVTDDGGAGTWVTGFTAVISLLIFILALRVGSRDFPLIDWIFLAGCVAAMALWALTDEPFTAVVLVTIIDILAFAPTFRKSYFAPESEPAFTYLLSGIKFGIAILALKEVTAVTALYPASLVATNLLFVTMILIRRRVNTNYTSHEAMGTSINLLHAGQDKNKAL